MEQLLGRSTEDFLAVPRHGGRLVSTKERRSIDLSPVIKGWGSDLNPADRPGVPRDKAPDLGGENLYIDIQRQVPEFKVFKSTEHAQLTPVFGTACPPRGVSGLIRDVAFRYSEGRLSHWILLMTADRVDMVEEILVDLAHLKVPNLFKEMGLASEFKYNKKGIVKKLVAGGIGAAAIYSLLRARDRQPQIAGAQTE